MAEFVKQGQVSILGTVLYTGSDSSILTKITTMRFNNPLAYTLRLERYDDATATTEIIYDLSLSAGDTVTDNLLYALAKNDQLIVYTNIPGTTYYVYGVDYI